MRDVQTVALNCRHCEERSDEAIQNFHIHAMDCFAPLAMTASNPCIPSEFEQPARTERNFQQFDAAAFQIERVLDRLCEQRPGRNGTGFTGALDAHRIEW